MASSISGSHHASSVSLRAEAPDAQQAADHTSATRGTEITADPPPSTVAVALEGTGSTISKTLHSEIERIHSLTQNVPKSEPWKIPAAITARTLAAGVTAGVSWGQTAAALDKSLNHHFKDHPAARQNFETAALTSSVLAAEQLIMMNSAVPLFHALANANITPVNADELYPDPPETPRDLSETERQQWATDKAAWKDEKEAFKEKQSNQIKNRVASTLLDLSFAASNFAVRRGQNEPMSYNIQAAPSWLGGALAGLTQSSAMLYASHYHSALGKRVPLFVAKAPQRPDARPVNEAAPGLIARTARHLGSSAKIAGNNLANEVLLKPKPWQGPATNESRLETTKRMATNTYNVATNTLGHLGGLIYRNFAPRSILGAMNRALPYENPPTEQKETSASNTDRRNENGGKAALNIFTSLVGGDYNAGPDRLKSNRPKPAQIEKEQLSWLGSRRTAMEMKAIGKDFSRAYQLPSRAREAFRESGRISASLNVALDTISTLREPFTIPARLGGAIGGDILDGIDSAVRAAPALGGYIADKVGSGVRSAANMVVGNTSTTAATQAPGTAAASDAAPVGESVINTVELQSLPAGPDTSALPGNTNVGDALSPDLASDEEQPSGRSSRRQSQDTQQKSGRPSLEPLISTRRVDRSS